MRTLKTTMNEGILADMNDTIEQGDKSAHLMNIKNFFDIERIKTNPSAGVIILHGLYFSRYKNNPDPLGKFISTMCSYDGKVLTINLDASKTVGIQLAITVVLGSDLPIIKFIDTSTAIRTKHISKNYALGIVSTSNNKVSLKDYFHPDSHVSLLSLSPLYQLRNLKCNIQCPILNDIIPFTCDHIVYQGYGNSDIGNIINNLPSNCRLYIDKDTIIKKFEQDHKLSRHIDIVEYDYYYVYKN
jgi:hypothetical protein